MPLKKPGHANRKPRRPDGTARIEPVKIIKGRLKLFGLNISKKLAVTVSVSVTAFIVAKTSLPPDQVAAVIDGILNLTMLYVFGQSAVDASSRVGSSKMAIEKSIPRATLIDPDQ